MTSLKRSLPLLPLLLLPQALNGAVIADYADYGPDDIDMNAQALGGPVAGQWAGAWSQGTAANRAKYESGSNLSFTATGYTNDTTGGRFERANNSAVHDRQFATALTGTVWMSGLVLGNRSDGRSNPQLSLSGENGEKALFGLFDSGTDIAATSYFGSLIVSGTNGSSVDTGMTFFNNTTHFLLTKVSLNYSGLLDRIEFWIDPDVSTVAANGEAGMTAATLSIEGADLFGNTLTNAGFSLSLPTAAADSLRIGTAGGDAGLSEVLTGVAVPEPSALALLATGFAGLLIRHRRI